MYYSVMEARYVANYTVWLRFKDGTEGEADLQPGLVGPVFEPLHDLAFFRQFAIDPIGRTLVWPNGADVAPETLYELVRVAA